MCPVEHINPVNGYYMTHWVFSSAVFHGFAGIAPSLQSTGIDASRSRQPHPWSGAVLWGVTPLQSWTATH
jgi:hypothetical protein